MMEGDVHKARLSGVLIENREQLLAAVQGLSEAQLSTMPALDEWTVKDVVGHVAYWEQVIHAHVREAYAEGRPCPMHEDETDEVINPREAAKRKDRPWRRVRAEFENARNALIRRVESLSDLDLVFQVPNTWWNEQRFYSVAEMIEEDAVGHCREHTLQITTWRSKQIK